MQAMNDQFGTGGWRAVERFLIIQPDGKQRVIDNARKSGHNTHTSMQETISTVNVDFVASVARMVNTALETHRCDPPDWLDLRLGTDDLPAYRGLPVQDDHLRFSNVAIFVPDEGRNRHYLGTSVHVGHFVPLGSIRFQPKFTTQRKVLAKLHLALTANSISPDDAGKLRGDLNWMFSMCAGQAGRIAGPTLTALQHADSPNLSPEDAVTLQLLAALVTCPGPRDVASPTSPCLLGCFI